MWLQPEINISNECSPLEGQAGLRCSLRLPHGCYRLHLQQSAPWFANSYYADHCRLMHHSFCEFRTLRTGARAAGALTVERSQAGRRGRRRRRCRRGCRAGPGGRWARCWRRWARRCCCCWRAARRCRASCARRPPGPCRSASTRKRARLGTKYTNVQIT